MKRTAIRKMSKVKAVEHRKYLKLKTEILNGRDGDYGTLCEMEDCLRTAEDVHHMRGRVGKMLTDRRYLMAICRTCHTWIHDHAKAARALGLLQ